MSVSSLIKHKHGVVDLEDTREVLILASVFLATGSRRRLPTDFCLSHSSHMNVITHRLYIHL